MSEIHGAVIDSVIGNLLEAKKHLDGTIMDTSTVNSLMAANCLIDKALESLGYKKEELQKHYDDGEYIFHHNSSAKRVHATFAHNGTTLLTLVDEDNNDWKEWAFSHGVFDPKKSFCYLKPVVKEAE